MNIKPIWLCSMFKPFKTKTKVTRPPDGMPATVVDAISVKNAVNK